jgi:hypothetical protein
MLSIFFPFFLIGIANCDPPCRIDLSFLSGNESDPFPSCSHGCLSNKDHPTRLTWSWTSLCTLKNGHGRVSHSLSSSCSIPLPLASPSVLFWGKGDLGKLLSGSVLVQAYNLHMLSQVQRAFSVYQEIPKLRCHTGKEVNSPKEN